MYGLHVKCVNIKELFSKRILSLSILFFTVLALFHPLIL